MFKVMIVEDEPPIMRMVKNSIENADNDFVVEKCCINGKLAMEELEENDYDIVVTDIKMPVMSGVELAKWIYENKPETKVILLSGYQDFEYARKALEYKVFDYLLKPISRDKMYELTVRIKSEFDKNKNMNSIGDDEKYTVVILACAGAYLLYGADLMLPGERFWTDDNIENFMDNTLIENEGYVFFNTNVQSERFVVVGTNDMERQELIVNSLYDNLKDKSLPITIMYKKGVKFKDAGKCFAQLREHLIKHLILDRSQIICCDSTTDVFDNVVPPYSKDDIEAVTMEIKNGNMLLVHKNLGKIIFSMRDGNCTQEEITGMLNVILDTYTLNYPNKLKRKNSSVKKEFVTAVAGFTSYEALLDDTTSILMTLRKEIAEADRYEQLADDIEEYIKNNYNKSITNDVLSKEFGFVPSYISRLFKQKKGVSPSEYMTRYRIALAKKILSDNPNIMIKEVANMVGFRESYYFSKTFKRETGVWPTEFVKQA